MSRWVTGLVSIVMPARDSQRFIRESIRSVISQSYSAWELLVVDDASSDATLEVVREAANDDSRIRVIQLAKNVGIAAARNAGIQSARGQFLAFLDSDDLWLKEKLQVQVGFMRHHDAAFSFTSYRRFGPDGALSPPVRVPGSLDYEQLLKGNVIGCLTVMIDRNRVSDFLMREVRHEDYVGWLQILKQGHTALGIQEDLALYRISPTSVSSDKMRSAAWTWNIYRRVEGLSYWKSVKCFAQYIAKAISIRNHA